MRETNPYHRQHAPHMRHDAQKMRRTCANHRQNAAHMSFATYVVVGSRVGDRCEQLVRALMAKWMACLAAPFLDGFRGYFVTSSWTSFANWASWTRARLGRCTPTFNAVAYGRADRRSPARLVEGLRPSNQPGRGR